MKAIVFVGPPTSKPYSFPKPENFDVVIGVDGGALLPLNLNWKLDVFVGDGDSLEPGRLQAVLRDPTVEKIVLPRYKEVSDTEAALMWCRQKGMTSVCLVGGLEGRVDHTLANWKLSEMYPEVDTWFLPDGQMTRISSDTLISVQKGQLCSVIPGGTGPWSIGSTGLEWELDGYQFPSGPSLSNVCKTDNLRLSPEKGWFWFYQPREGGTSYA